MERVTGPLAKMGGQFLTEFHDGNRFIKTHAHGGLTGIRYDSPVASAQVKTALVLAALNARGETIFTEPELSRNHTEIMLQSLGAGVVSEGTTLRVDATTKLKSFKMTVPGDISSATFFIVGALITPDSDVLIRRVNLNPTRTGILDALMAMGADIEILSRSEEGGEAVGDLHVHTSELKNTDVGGAIIPRLIDEIPILALAAATASGPMTLSDAKELRVKETDRIRAVCHELANLGADITERPDGFVVMGRKRAYGNMPLLPQSKMFSSYGDHRMAMTLIIAGLNLDQPIEIDDVACINTSFPEFFELLGSIR
jgi:3-phosphoshikimate 1-carboxyvinyltransferase